MTGTEKLIDSVEFDVNGTNGQGGNGGLLSDTTIRAAGDLRIIMSHIQNTAPSWEAKSMDEVETLRIKIAQMKDIRDQDAAVIQKLIAEKQELQDRVAAASNAPPVTQVGWLPISSADKSIDRVYNLPGMPRPISNSEEYWCRDTDGRVFLAAWADDGKRAYWWDLDGESIVDPVEFMPHPLDTRFAALAASEGGDHG